ncbi:MAG: UvrB/UvrC motif-containing protein [Kiritimatiellae bacterium]|nr:UvrB/UvrC motif-containing protein [Kiritimatiellia bacterium]MDD5520256.1 UvrB/UvrC motif-containing protein [Kiritimatiellia bacterium]
MQCELCKQNEAVVHLKHAFNGEVREVHLCSNCAAKKGFVAKLSPASLTDFLFGMDAQKKTELQGPDISCPNCHMRRSDFRKTSRFGCGACYQAFKDDLIPLLDEFQKGRRHVGKVPVMEKHAIEITVLQKKLALAVEAQNFEEAARLRDAIQVLQVDRKNKKRVDAEVV